MAFNENYRTATNSNFLDSLAPIAVHIKADLADEVAVLDALGEGVVLHRKTGQRFC